MENLPDQGQEKGAGDRKTKEDREQPHKGQKRGLDDDKTSEREAPLQKLCLVCKERHTPFCKMPEGFRKELRAKTKANRKGGKGKGKSEKSHPGSKGGAKAES